MHVPTLIEKKREGNELTGAEIAHLVSGFTSGEIADYQMSAWAMAVFFQGMTPAETGHLTKAMMESGRVLEYSRALPRKSTSMPPAASSHSDGRAPGARSG